MIKRILIRYWPGLFLSVLWFIFSYPFFIKGLIPFPSDYLVNNFAPWSAYPGFAGPVKNDAMPDVITQIFPWKDLVIEMWRNRQIPLWNPYMFSGTPLLANYQSAALSPLNLLYFVLPFVDAWSIQVLLQPLFAGLFTYIFIRSLKLSKAAAVFASTAFMFCGFITSWMSYGTLALAIVFLPLALFAIEKFYETKKWYYSYLLSISIPLSFFSGHFQISLYFLIFILAYCSFKYYLLRNFKSYILNLGSVVFGIFLCAPQLIPSIEFYQEAVRSATFLKTESIPWSYLPTLFAPDFFGNSVTRNNWFGHYAEWNGYIGILPLVFAIYSTRRINSNVLFFILTGLIALLLAYESPLQDLVYQLKFPVLSTSAASRIIVLFSFSFSVLAAFGFDNILSDIKQKKYSPIHRWIFVLVMIFVSFWVVTFIDLLFPESKNLITRSNLRFPTLILMSGLVVLLVSYFSKLKKYYFILIFLLLVISALDLYRFSTKWQPFGARSLIFPEVGVSKFLKENAGYDRVFGNFGGEAAMTLRAASIEGYDPLYSRRYGEFLGAAADGLFHLPPRSAITFTKTGEYTPLYINLLGVKYFVHKRADDRQVWAFPIWRYPTEQFKIAYEDDAYQIFQNQKVFPRILMLGEAVTIDDDKNLLQKMLDADVDLKQTVFLEEKIIKIEKDENSTAVIEKYTPNQVIIEAKSTKPQILVLTDPFYPGWKASINGISVKIYRADYTFRAVRLDPGINRVVFSYFPDSFRMGLVGAIIGLIGIGLSSFYLWKTK